MESDKPMLKLIEFPKQDIRDVPNTLRRLAANIEAGEYGDAHNVAFVVDCGHCDVKIGMIGRAASPGAEAHLLFAIGMRKLELL